jgi:hypothetical protein
LKRQNAPGARISFPRQFEQFLDLIHLEVYPAVDLNGVLSLVENHPRVALLRVLAEVA